MIDYELIINSFDITAAGVIIMMMAMSWYYIGALFLSQRKIKEVPHSDKKSKFAVLVPARNEGKIIINIINSLHNQTYDPNYFDIWFILESKEDIAYDIALKNGCHVFIRDELTADRRTKGFALQECIRYFKKENMKYDAYMIFDADNVMDSNYLEAMNDLRQSGVEVGVGYRNFTNANVNWRTSCSACLFTYINSFTSKSRTLLFKKAVISGTGYYINADIVDEAGGWIFTGMTEDTELTSYCYYHDINMRYYPLVNYYDEQATDFKTMHNQHIRWIWGFFTKRSRLKHGVKHQTLKPALYRAARMEYALGLFPFACFAIINFLILVASLVLGFTSFYFDKSYTGTLFIHALFQFLILYSVFMVVAIAVIAHDNNKLHLKSFSIIWCVLMYAFFFADLLFAFIDGLIHKKKRTTWKPIKHSGKIKDKRAKSVSKDA